MASDVVVWTDGTVYGLQADRHLCYQRSSIYLVCYSMIFGEFFALQVARMCALQERRSFLFSQWIRVSLRGEIQHSYKFLG